MMDRFAKKLEQLESQNCLRTLKKPAGIDLTSNDYLGLRNHPALRQAAIEALEAGIDIGAGGSRLLHGHTQHHESLEIYAAEFFGCDKALYFPTGFQANYALFSTLPNRHDVIVFDEYLHASARDGIAASHARKIKARHNDLQSFDEALSKAKKQRKANGKIWVAVDSLYSMDGDLAPVKALYELAQKYEAMLVVDEAHATGVLGPNGRGLAFKNILQFSDSLDSLDSSIFTTDSTTFITPSPPNSKLCKIKIGAKTEISAKLPPDVITIHACGKALGVAGGFICGASDIIDTLINTARPFIFSTAPPPLQAYITQKSLELVAGEEGNNLRASLSQIIAHTALLILHYVKPNIGEREVSGCCGVNHVASYDTNYGDNHKVGRGHINVGDWGRREPTHIVPIILGSDEKAVRTATMLQSKGYDIRAIRPPTVPKGTARLRLALSVDLDNTLIDKLFLEIMKG